MENFEKSSPEELYADSLKEINGIKFTRREIEIISFLISGRSPKRIATFLSVAPKTIENHTHNIMLKLECNSREGIIDFVENSSKIMIFRKYGTHLQVQLAFEVALKKFSILAKKENLSCSFYYWREKGLPNLPVHPIEKYLKQAGIDVKTSAKEKPPSLSQFMQGRQDTQHTLCIPPQTWLNSLEPEKSLSFSKEQKGCVFLLPAYENHKALLQLFKKHTLIHFAESPNFYVLIFDVLKKLFPNVDLQKIFSDFQSQCKGLEGSFNISSPQSSFEEKVRGGDRIPSNAKIKTFLYEKKVYLLWGTLFIASIGVLFFYILQQQQASHSIRSALNLPIDSVLLERSHLMNQINEHLKKAEGIQTVVLIGLGGAGKTTLARRYSHHQKASLVWEINAETTCSLRVSFENLAYQLALTDADKKILKDFQGIKDAVRREENMILFVQDRLKHYNNWILIYNDVNNFTNIQNYFPDASKNWGTGKIILTTRNLNIQNNEHLNNFIYVGELTPQEKASLFTKIINKGGTKALITEQQEHLKEFLKSIPPFPLDVSVAARYLKSTNLPYERYLAYLHKQENDFVVMQENILKEIGEYTKSRYGIITLSLKDIVKQNKEFINLFFFVSLLNSQDISRGLLSLYTKDSIVDDFIHHLNEHSFLMNNKKFLFNTKGHAPFSIHESTQEIILSHLKKLSLENEKNLVEKFAITLSTYISNLRKEDNFQEINNSINHCKTFFSHNELLSDSTRGILEANLANSYFLLGFYEKAKEYFEQSLWHLKKSDKKNDTFTAETLVSFGKMQGILGQYEEAKRLIEQGIKIYSERMPHHYSDIAWAYANLGNVHNFQGNCEQGKQFLEKSLLMYKAHTPKDHAAMAKTTTELAMSYRNLGHYKKAKTLLEESLQLFKRILPDHHIKMAQTLIYLGVVEREVINHTKAKLLIEEGVSILKKHLPENHPDIAWALVHLGAIHRAQGNNQEAKKLILQGFKISQSHFSENHSMIAWEYTQLAKLHKKVKNYGEAKKLLNSAMRIYENLFGQESISIARTHRNLGRVYFQEGLLEEAEKSFRQAVKIFQKSNHSEQSMVLEHISDLMIEKAEQAKEKGNTTGSQSLRSEATECLKQSLDIMNTYYPEDSPHILRAREKLKILSALEQ